MSVFKRNTRYWMDVTVDGQRYREPLNTVERREARTLELRRITEIARRPPDPGNRRRPFGALDIKTAIETYAAERRAQVSARMVAYWKENARPLAAFFDRTPLRKIDSG